MRTYLIFLLMVLLSTASCSNAAIEDTDFLTVKGSGLSIADAEDGQWQVSDVGGRKAITLKPNTKPASTFIYFKLTPELRTAMGSDFYIVVDVFVNGLKIIRTDYNNSQSPYANASVMTMLGNGEWQNSYVHITDAKLAGLQNGGADFRLYGGDGLAIGKIEITKEKPSGNINSAKEILTKYFKENPRRTDMFYTFGNDADETSAILYKSLGVTSVESYVTWETVEREAEGKWDWTQWDKQVKILKDTDLKWVPFLILSPAYSTPNWFRASSEHVPCRCLEHNIDSKVESLWNPYLPARIERFISEFAKRYKDTGVIESVLLGIQGDFGEAIYSVTGGGWTFNVPGEYHNHHGFWCADPYALKDFKKYMKDKYKNIEVLNKAWKTDYSSFDALVIPGSNGNLAAFRQKIPTGDPGIRRQWIDFVDWYRASMTDWSDWWMMITRKYFPETPIYLCTGGDAPPEHGSNFAEQCRVSAKHNGGVRITNEASNYASNFMVTRWVASAGKHYNAYFGFEPAGTEDEKGIVVRIYNATASGANQLHDYNPNIVNSSKTMDIQKEHFKYLFHVKDPKVPVAVWYPNVSLTLKWGGFLEKTARLRDYSDIDFVDETMLRTGALKRNKILIILHGEVIESKDASLIVQWIRSGGRVIVMDVPKFESVEGTNTPEKSLFGNLPEGRSIGKGSIVRVAGWSKLAAELKKTMAELNLPVYDVKEDGIYGTQIDDSEFLFLNTKNAAKINIDMNDETYNVDIPAGTITRFKCK